MFLVRLTFVLFVSILSCFKVAAQNPPPGSYSLTLFENEYFRDFTFQELKSRLLINQDVVDLNICNGNENVLLPDLVKSNPKNDSLRILNSSNKSVLTYRDGQLYNSSGKIVSLSSLSDSYTKAIFGFIEQIRKFPQGLRLISLMQKALYPVTLSQIGGPRFEFVGSTGKPNSGYDEATVMQHFAVLRKSDEKGITFKQFGAGGFVRFDPFMKNLSNIESDNIKRSSPVLAAFAHELFHAFDSVRGLMDRRGVIGVGMEFSEVTEWRAVYFENIIRKNLGRKYRKFYGQVDLNDPVQSQESMLDKTGQPILLPTPCLKP